MLTLSFREYNSHGQEYVLTVLLDASTQEEVDEILEVVETRGETHPKYKESRDQEPKGFGEAGGFCSDFESATDEKGQDKSHLVKDWYGPPSKRVVRTHK
jgi:hypothetical protein